MNTKKNNNNKVLTKRVTLANKVNFEKYFCVDFDQLKKKQAGLNSLIRKGMPKHFESHCLTIIRSYRLILLCMNEHLGTHSREGIASTPTFLYVILLKNYFFFLEFF